MLKRLFNATSLKANVLANLVGNGWVALINIIFVPLYLKYIGPEGYGLIGIFTSLQVMLSLLDSGLSTSLNKDIAKLSVLPDTQLEMRNLVKTLGSVYWVMAIVAGLIAVCLSPFIAKYWVQANELNTETITYAFILLSLSIIFQFTSGFYGGGLLGLQRQVILNVLRILFAILKNFGVLFILLFISKSVLAFFSWTLFVSILQAFTYKYSLWLYLPKSFVKPLFDKKMLKNIWRFAAGVTGISLTSILLTQVDKIILSKILMLEQFGYYTFAFTVGSMAYMIVGPISQSYFPKLSVLLARHRIEELDKIYHQGCQLVTLLVVPFALFLSFFSREILFIWTHNSDTVNNTWQLTSVVTLAVAIHCLMVMPYMLCLAHSHTKLALVTNSIILLALIPGTIFSAIHFGALGGAVCWLIVTIIYLFINPIMIHKYFLKGQAFNWYWNDTFKPIIGCILIFTATRVLLIEYHFGLFPTLCLLALTGFVGFMVTLVSLKDFRENLTDSIKIQFNRKNRKINVG